jgi:hypothetical protein
MVPGMNVKGKMSGVDESVDVTARCAGKMWVLGFES